VDRQLTEEEIRQALFDMESDDMFITNSNYSRTLTDTIKLLTFQEWHMEYLSEHPKVNALNYLTNLKVMTKQRS